MPIKFADMVLSGNGPLPLGTYTVRCLSAELGATAKGDPCIKTKWEIVGPPIVEVDGKKYNIAGRQFWPGPQSLDPSNGRNGIGAFLDKLSNAGFDMSSMSTDEGDAFDESKVAALVGFTCDMSLSSEPQFKTRLPTQEEIAAGVRPAERIPLVDGAGDKVSSGHRIKAWLTDITGPATNAGL